MLEIIAALIDFRIDSTLWRNDAKFLGLRNFGVISHDNLKESNAKNVSCFILGISSAG